MRDSRSISKGVLIFSAVEVAVESQNRSKLEVLEFEFVRSSPRGPQSGQEMRRLATFSFDLSGSNARIRINTVFDLVRSQSGELSVSRIKFTSGHRISEAAQLLSLASICSSFIMFSTDHSES